jgi:hypothetical protein
MDTGDEGNASPSPVVEDNERRDRPSDEEGGKEGGGRASEPDPNRAGTVVVTVVAPSEPEDAPVRAAQPVEDGEARGGIEDTEESSPEAPPVFDRLPLPVPDAPSETTKPDGRRDIDGGEKDRDAPKAGDAKRDEEGERGDRPDAEEPEDRPESGSEGESGELQPASDEEKPTDEVQEEDPEVNPEPSAGEDTVPGEPGDPTTVAPGEADSEG